MTSAEIAHELRAARPSAPPALRARILGQAARPSLPTPSLLSRLLHRRILLLAPGAAVLATAVAVAIGVTDSSTPGQTVQAPQDAVHRDQAAAPETTAPPAGTAWGAADAGRLGKSSALDAIARAQRIVASLTLRVEDGDALSAAVRDAVRITRSLDGYVVSSDVVAGDTGTAAITLRVPARNAQDAIARLSELGTIVGQRIQADDLQETLDALGAEVARLRKALALVRAQLADEGLDAERRAALQVRRDELAAALRATSGQRDATAAEAATATITLSLGTGKDAGAVPPTSRLDRTLTRALDVLAWEAVTVLGLLVVLAPLGLALAALRLGRRSARRWSDARTLGAS